MEVTSAAKVQDYCYIKNSWKVEIGSASCVAFGEDGQLLVLARQTQLFVFCLMEQNWKQVFSQDMHFYPRAITVIDHYSHRFDILVSGACGVVIVPCNLNRQEKCLTTLLEGTCGHCCCCLTSYSNRLIAAATTDGRAAVWLREETTSNWKPVASLMPVHEALSLAACDRIVDAALCYCEEEQLYLLALGWWNGAVLVYRYPHDFSSYKLQWSRRACSNSLSWKDIPCGYLTWYVSGQQLIVCTEPFRISVLDRWDGSLMRTIFVPSHFLCQGISICDDYLFLLLKNMCQSKWSVVSNCHVGDEACKELVNELERKNAVTD